MGDVNMDGRVTALDSLLIQRYTVNLTKFDEIQKFVADVNQDGKITAKDSLLVLRYAVKLIPNINIGEYMNIPKELMVS